MTFIDIFLGVVSICGSALAVFVLVAEWKAFTHPRAQRQELPPEVRRQNDRNGIAAGLGLAVVAGVIFCTYEWGAHRWTTATGAALAIGVSLIAVVGGVTAMLAKSNRELTGHPSSDRADDSR